MIKVNTGRLRDGDKIHAMGAVIEIEGKPEIIERGRKIFYAWRNMKIIAGRLEGLPQATAWTIQGSKGILWRVTR